MNKIIMKKGNIVKIIDSQKVTTINTSTNPYQIIKEGGMELNCKTIEDCMIGYMHRYELKGFKKVPCDGIKPK